MARTDYNVLGRQSGKIGNVVGMVRKGVQLYRAYTNKYALKETEAARIIRARFALIGSMAASFKVATRIGLSKAVGPLQTPSNLFVKLNWGAVTATDPESVDVDYDAIKVSQGRCPWVSFNTPSFAEEAEVSVTFDTGNSVTGASADDKVYLFVYQPDTDMGVLSLPVARGTGSVTVALPAIWSGMKVHLYGFAVSAGSEDEMGVIIEKGTPSLSAYVGTGTVA